MPHTRPCHRTFPLLLDHRPTGFGPRGISLLSSKGLPKSGALGLGYDNMTDVTCPPVSHGNDRGVNLYYDLFDKSGALCTTIYLLFPTITVLYLILRPMFREVRFVARRQLVGPVLTCALDPFVKYQLLHIKTRQFRSR